MKTLNEIKRNIISFYSRIQDRVTDFTVGSVVHDIIYSVSASLETIHRNLATIEQQAYIATASGQYLDKLIDGTFQFKRSPATRSVGYVIFYGDSPLTNPGAVKLQYADFDYATGQFTGGLQTATKVIGHNVQGDDGLVYALISPKNREAVEETGRLIDLGGRNVQYLVLPVASVLTGSKSNIIEGGITKFPSPPVGINKVINTSNPGNIFFSSGEDISNAPFYSRFTEAIGYSDGVLRVVNSFNFSLKGFIEIKGDIYNREGIVGLYTKVVNGVTISRQAGLIFEYIDRDTGYITLNNGITVPELTITENGEVHTLTLTSLTHNGVPVPDITEAGLQDFIENSTGLVVHQRPDQVSAESIFDPDGILGVNYRISETDMVGGGVDQDNDEVYRDALRRYLGSLSRATPTALEAGALQTPGITFAKTLGSEYTPRGSTSVLVSNADGVVSDTVRREVAQRLDELWKAAGVNVIVRSPELVRTHVSMVIKPVASTSNVVTHRQVSTIVGNYLRRLNPGDSIKYSDVLAELREIPSIENVFNLLVLKDLTVGTYNERKAEYDLEFLMLLGGKELREIEGPYDTNDIVEGAVVAYDSTLDAYYSIDPTNPVELENAVGLVYYTSPSGYGIITSDRPDSILDMFYAHDGLELALTPDTFQDVVRGFRDSFSTSDHSYAYVASYLFSEPMEDVPGIQYPVNPLTVQYQFVTDYDALEVQLFRLDNLYLTQDTTMPYVGIRFIT